MHNSGNFGYNHHNVWDGGGGVVGRDHDQMVLGGFGGNSNYIGMGGYGNDSVSVKNQKREKLNDANGANSKYTWSQLEITGSVCNLSSTMWNLTHLTKLSLQNNSLTCLSGEIALLQSLVTLDLSSNKLRDVPSELGEIFSLKELMLNNNCISRLPCELGRLFNLKTLGLTGNPLPSHLLNMCSDSNKAQKLVFFLQDKLPDVSNPLPERPWIQLGSPEKRSPSVQFTVMCYNVLSDKYCTRQMYPYCQSWALTWDYRKKHILQEMRNYGADIISLQEVETEQFYSFFLPELELAGYSGVFSAKSRARTMMESERKHVDGCAVFYLTEKFRLIKDHLIEFNQIAIEAADGQHDMINRVMTKDNIGLAVMLEVQDKAWLNTNGVAPMVDSGGKQKLLVATCHVHWDPEFCDVKLIQTMMFMHKLQTIIKEVQQSKGATSSSSLSGSSDSANGSTDTNSIPLILCGDLNSLPDSGVVEYLLSGYITTNHKDFKQLSYHDCLHKLSHVPSQSKGTYSHGFKLAQGYNSDILPFTNYTNSFKGVIDYIFHSRQSIRVLGVLGGIAKYWFEDNRIPGCPHPKIPSDHLPLYGHFEITKPSGQVEGQRSQSLHHNTGQLNFGRR